MARHLELLDVEPTTLDGYESLIRDHIRPLLGDEQVEQVEDFMSLSRAKSTASTPAAAQWVQSGQTHHQSRYCAVQATFRNFGNRAR